MFKATLNQASVFKRIVDGLKELINNINLEANSEGLNLQAMDSAHVCLVWLKLNESGFAEYRCDKTTNLGLSLQDLSKVLKLAGNDDEMSLTSDINSSSLTIKFVNKKTERSSEFQLNLINLEVDSLGIPSCEYPSSITMNSSEFFKTCKEISTLSETLNINITDKNMATFNYEGKLGNGKTILKTNKDEKGENTVLIKCNESVNKRYGLSYINNFSKASSLSNLVEVNFSENFPMKIHLDIDELGFIEFYLAPKLDDDDE